jgi:hypothetical protein
LRIFATVGLDAEGWFADSLPETEVVITKLLVKRLDDHMRLKLALSQEF